MGKHYGRAVLFKTRSSRLREFHLPGGTSSIGAGSFLRENPRRVISPDHSAARGNLDSVYRAAGEYQEFQRWKVIAEFDRNPEGTLSAESPGIKITSV